MANFFLTIAASNLCVSVILCCVEIVSTSTYFREDTFLASADGVVGHVLLTATVSLDFCYDRKLAVFVR